MACFEPKPAWQYYRGGRPQFVPPQDPRLFRFLDVPCGRCIGCRVRLARDWSIRCALEAQEHNETAWATLTYSDEHLPPTLWPGHLLGYMKRLRARLHPTRIKHFGVGEYGDNYGRPHYHVILYGVAPTERHIAESWRFGHVDVDPLTPARIAYTAGYAQKKLAASIDYPETVEGVDRETGEVVDVRFQAPFRSVSRRPAIGYAAKRYARSWRTSAIHDGREVPVPRYLHEAWKAAVDEDALAELQAERAAVPRLDFARREAGQVIALVKHQQQTERRKIR